MLSCFLVCYPTLSYPIPNSSLSLKSPGHTVHHLPQAGGGGAVYTVGVEEVVVESSKFLNCSSASYGGAVLAVGAIRTSFANNVLFGNTARFISAGFGLVHWSSISNTSHDFNGNHFSQQHVTHMGGGGLGVVYFGTLHMHNRHRICDCYFEHCSGGSEQRYVGGGGGGAGGASILYVGQRHKDSTGAGAVVLISHNHMELRDSQFMSCRGGNHNTFTSAAVATITSSSQHIAMATGGGGGAGGFLVVYAPTVSGCINEPVMTAVIAAQVEHNSDSIVACVFQDCIGGRGNMFESTSDSCGGVDRSYSTSATGGGAGAGAFAIVHAPAASASHYGVALATSTDNHCTVQSLEVQNCSGGSSTIFQTSSVCDSGDDADPAVVEKSFASSASGGGGGSAGFALVHAPAAASSFYGSAIANASGNTEHFVGSTAVGCHGGSGTSFRSNSQSSRRSADIETSSSGGGGGGSGAFAFIKAPSASCSSFAGEAKALSSTSGNTQYLQDVNITGCSGGRQTTFRCSSNSSDGDGYRYASSSLGGGSGAGGIVAIFASTASASSSSQETVFCASTPTTTRRAVSPFLVVWGVMGHPLAVMHQRKRRWVRVIVIIVGLIMGTQRAQLLVEVALGG